MQQNIEFERYIDFLARMIDKYGEEIFRELEEENLNSILATFPEWGQKVPPLSLFGGEKLFHVFLNQINFKS